MWLNRGEGMVWPAGRVVFVAGAASRIGLGRARALVAAGARAALADIDGARVAAAKVLVDTGGVVVGAMSNWRSGWDSNSGDMLLFYEP